MNIKHYYTYWLFNYQISSLICTQCGYCRCFLEVFGRNDFNHLFVISFSRVIKTFLFYLLLFTNDHFATFDSTRSSFTEYSISGSSLKGSTPQCLQDPADISAGSVSLSENSNSVFPFPKCVTDLCYEQL